MTGDAPLAMTMGDPAGIGPELALAAWRDRALRAPFVVFASPGLLAAAAKRAGFPVPIVETDLAGARAAFWAGLPVVPLKSVVEDAPGRPNAANAAATIESIERAVEAGEGAAVANRQPQGAGKRQPRLLPCRSTHQGQSKNRPRKVR